MNFTKARILHRISLLGALLLLTGVAIGQSVDFNNFGGTLTGDASGLTASSQVFRITGLKGNSDTGATQATLSFTTGSLIDGSVQTGATFNGGGSFVIVSSGSAGNPPRTLFSGSFNGPVTWAMITFANGTHSYTLVGSLSGTLAKSLSSNSTVPATGATVQLTLNTGVGYFSGVTSVSSGDTSFTPTQ